MEHTCHAHGCKSRVPPSKFVCLKHWRALPKALQVAIWREYQAGQERTKTPSARYMAVQQRAVGYLAFKPNDEAAARAAAPYLINAEIWRRRCVDGDMGDPLAGIPGGTEAPDPELDIAKAQHAIGAIRAEARSLGEL